eukprot:1892669-Rhodomonas_salina.1
MHIDVSARKTPKATLADKRQVREQERLNEAELRVSLRSVATRSEQWRPREQRGDEDRGRGQTRCSPAPPRPRAWTRCRGACSMRDAGGQATSTSLRKEGREREGCAMRGSAAQGGKESGGG